jgi:hypothetical protein
MIQATSGYQSPATRDIGTLGGSTVAAYFISQSPLEYEFATKR